MKVSRQKLYCYVDETGQDTKGELFIVVAIVMGNTKEAIEAFLTKTEQKSGKRKRKWIKTRKKERKDYLELVLTQQILHKIIFYHIQEDTKAYEAQTIITIEQAIRQYISSFNITHYKATIVIDGLSQKVAERVGVALRKAGISVRKIRGERDESNAILRLADSLAGVIREAKEGNVNYEKLEKRLEKEKLLNEV